MTLITKQEKEITAKKIGNVEAREEVDILHGGYRNGHSENDPEERDLVCKRPAMHTSEGRVFQAKPVASTFRRERDVVCPMPP